MSFSQTGSTINPYANKANSYNPYANSANSGSTLNTPIKSVVNPTVNTPQTQATQTGLMNNKTFNGAATPVKSTPNNGSVVDYLNSQGKASDYNSRTGLATQYGIARYTGTADQNTQLLGKLQGGNSPVIAPVSQNSGFTGSSQSNTGNSSTNNGMITLGNTQPQYKNDANLYSNVVTGLANTAQNTQELSDANKSLQDLQNEYQKQNNLIQSRGWDLSEQGGAQGMLKNSYNTANAAAQDRIQNALTAQSNTGNILNNAGNLAKPMLANYGQQVFNPTNGSLSGGTLNDAVNQVVEKLKSGQMSYADAQEALSGYGQGGTNALLSALPAGFNVAQSNTLANQQGSIGVNYQLANTALQNVEDRLKELGGAQKTNIPLVNKGANWISTQFGVGSEQTRAMTGAVQSLRNAYASLLSSAKGGTPTDYSYQAEAEIPNEPTPNDIAAIRSNFEVLGKAKEAILSNPGVVNNNQNQGGTMFGSFYNN